MLIPIDEINDPSMLNVDFNMVDIISPKNVQIQIKKDGKVVWINVDGACRLRCCRIGQLEIIDERELKSIAEVLHNAPKQEQESDIENRRFEFWDNEKCYARLAGTAVSNKFHTMKIGEQCTIGDLSNLGHYIMRVK
jgi:hypothetical protein